MVPSLFSYFSSIAARFSGDFAVFARVVVGIAFSLPCAVSAQAPVAPGDWGGVRPVLEQHCYDCHGGKKTKGGVDLKRLNADPKVAGEFELWNKVLEAMKSGDMPPDDQPGLSAADRQRSLDWLGGAIEQAVRANAGDPGLVTVRRLTNAEYDRTLRDLTGVDLQLSRDFVPDGGGGEGFSNVGDVLFVSPQQLDKYFSAARKVADHASILPGSGVAFQPQRVGLRGPVQIKAQAEQGLYVWYQKMAAPFIPKDGEDQREAEYMLACWKFKHRELTGAQSLGQLAQEARLVPAFLENWWELLNNPEPKSRFLDLTRLAWRELPGPDSAQPREVPAAVRERLAVIQSDQRSWLGPAKNPGWGVQRRQQDADGIREYPVQIPVAGAPLVHLVAGDCGDGNKGDWVQFAGLQVRHGKDGKQQQPYLEWLRGQLERDRATLKFAEQPEQMGPSPDLAPVRERVGRADALLAQVGRHPLGLEAAPDAFVVQAPADLALPLPAGTVEFKAVGRLDQRVPEADAATAQWTLFTGPVPDLTRILPGVLTVWKIQTETARNTMRDFGAMRTVFPDEYVRRLEEVSRNFHRGGKGRGVYYLSDTQLLAMIGEEEKVRWERMMGDWRLVWNPTPSAQQGAAWDAALKKHVTEFAERAWRRPLAEQERAQMEGFYDGARGRELDRESSAREALVRVLVAPQFLFKLEDAAQPGERRLDAWELASRLSYMIWASMPDAALRAAAADGSLLRRDVLLRETRRMLQDSRASALAEEFAGQWLRFSAFEEKANIDPAKFPEFTPQLRGDMHREAAEFFTHLIREDRSVREVCGADYTFLNERLAAFYGVPGVKGEQFQKVSVSAQQRGGILGMGALLAKNSYPHRTSPVLRGNWLLDAVLGAPTPPPPNDVPKLDDSAAKPASLRARLEAHRADRACAVCHDRIDPLGFALEGFDPIGRLRTTDDASQPIDDSAQWKNGPAFRGLSGLRGFLASRQEELDRQFCRKLLGYALGRTLLPTDRPLLDTMSAELAKHEGRFSAAVFAVVESRQFQKRRNESLP